MIHTARYPMQHDRNLNIFYIESRLMVLSSNAAMTTVGSSATVHVHGSRSTSTLEFQPKLILYPLPPIPIPDKMNPTTETTTSGSSSTYMIESESTPALNTQQ